MNVIIEIITHLIQKDKVVTHWFFYEKIARNVHDVWAQSRITEGWTYGPKRNDALKQTPCLVDYDDLTEEEKAYDRNTAMETLKLIVKMGYKIKM